MMPNTAATSASKPAAIAAIHFGLRNADCGMGIRLEAGLALVGVSAISLADAAGWLLPLACASGFKEGFVLVLGEQD